MKPISPVTLLTFQKQKRTDNSDLPHLVQAIPVGQHDSFGSLIGNHVSKIDKIIKETEAQEDLSEKSKESKLKSLISSAKGLTSLLHTFIEQEKVAAPKSVYDAVCGLHDLIFSFGTSPKAREIQIKIVELCELWYLQERDGNEQIIPQTVTYLLAKTLESDGKTSDLKRLNRIKKGISFLDLDESVAIRQLLQQASIHPLYLLNGVGKKLIAYFLNSLNLTLTDEIHQAILNNLIDAKNWTVEAYAEIYFRAWKESSGPFKISIERSCIQDFINHGVHLKNTSLQKSVTQILKYFHSQKINFKHVDAMLIPLYEPILWRALQVANPLVRRNAVEQFAVAFPLISDEWTTEQIDEALQKQFELVQQLHSDPVPSVRVESIHLTGHILTNFFDFVPYRVSQVFLATLTQSLSKDKSSGEVRRAVIRALTSILKVPSTHAMMKELLPNIKFLIHDTSEQVRKNIIQLLIVLKGIKDIKYFEIIPLKDILARLPLDQKLIPLLMNLLLDSYFPYGRKKSNYQLIKRCILMIKDSPEAARIFYSNLVSQVPASTVVSFIVGLWKKCLYKWIQTRQLAKELGEEFDEELMLNDESKKKKPFLKVSELSIASVMFEIMALLWKRLDLTKEEDQPLVSFLANSFDDTVFVSMHEFWMEIYQDPNFDLETVANIQKSIFEMAGCISASCLPSFVRSATGYLTPDTDPQIQNALLIALFGWNYGEKTVEMAAGWISKFNEDLEEQDEDIEEISFGLKLFHNIISDKILRRAVLSQQEILNTMIGTLAPWMGKISKRLSGETQHHHYDHLLLAAMDLYYRLLIHVLGEIGPSQDFGFFRDLLEWCQTNIIANFEQLERNGDLDDSNPNEFQSFAQEVAQISFLICSETCVLGLSDLDLTSQLLTQIGSLLSCQIPISSKETYLRLAFKTVYHLYHSGRDQTEEKDLHNKCLDFFIFVLEKLQPELFLYFVLEKLQPELLQNAFKMTEFFTLATSRMTMHPLIEIIFQTILESIPIPEEFPVEYDYPEELKNKMAIHLLKSIRQSNTCIAIFGSYLNNRVLGQDPQLINYWMVLQLISVLTNSTKNSKAKTDFSAIQNILMTTLSRVSIQGNDVRNQTELNETMIRSQADSLLKLSHNL